MMRGDVFVALFALLLVTLPAKASAEKYYIPPSQFNAAYQPAGETAIAFRSATGGFSYDSDSKTISHVRLALDARRTPLASFQATEVTFTAAESKFTDNKGEIKGTLTVLGLSKPTTLEATLSPADTPDGGLDLSLRGSFKRADFGLNTEGTNDSIALLLEAQAIRQ